MSFPTLLRCSTRARQFTVENLESRRLLTSGPGASNASITTLVSSLNPAVIGQTVGFTATVAPQTGSAVPTGTVTFYDGTVDLGAVTLNGAGVGGFVTNTLPAGSHTITADYSGNLASSASNTVNETITQFASTTTLAVAATSTSLGQNVQLTATVHDDLGNPVNTGVVNFIDSQNGQEIDASTVYVVNGKAVLNYKYYTGGTHQFTAEYSVLPSPMQTSSTSNSVGVTIAPVAPTVALASSANPQSLPGSVTFTATITPPAVASIFTASGAVDFLDGANVIGSGVVNASGVATFTSSTLSVGSHAITADYLGDNNLSSIASSPLTQVISSSATTTSLAISPNSSPFGQPAQFTATVVDALGNPAPSGSVGFFEQAQGLNYFLGSSLVFSGQAVFSDASLVPGSHQIVAAFYGTTTLESSVSTAQIIAVSRANTTLSLSSTANPHTTGRPITLTATISQPLPTYHPTGTVTFYDGSTVLGSASENYAGIATLTTTLPAGANSIHAVYSGDSEFSTSTSNSLTVPIIQVPASITTLKPSASAVATNGHYSLTVTVAPIVKTHASRVATGEIYLYEDGNVVAGAHLNSAGKAIFSFTATGPEAVHSFYATYSGNSTYSPSNSNTVSETLSVPDGPLVTSVTTTGSTTNTNTLVVHFNESLNTTTADNVVNYLILNAAKGVPLVDINQAVYNAANDTVTLTLGSSISLNGRYNLGINGAAPLGITDTSGHLLDGKHTGSPGSNFLLNLNAKTVAVPVGPALAFKH